MKKPLSWPIIGTASLTVVLVFMISALLFLTKNTTPLSTAFNESSNEGLGGEDAVKEDKLEEILPVYREVTLMPGQTQQIQLYTYPQNADLSQLEWESSQENIKISSAGYVNSRFPGSEGIVKVRDKNGSLETQCKVRVMSEEEAFYNTINLINTGNLEDNMLINFTEDNFKPGDKQLHSRTDEAIAIFDLVNRELATYSVIQKQLINAQTNNNIDCDVYMERETGDIRKIVTIEHLADTLEITDYYFKDGKVYFIFQRHENYYRPVAAQQDFPGERCYIVDDAIVRWREIHKNSNDMFEKTDYYHVKEGFSWVTKEYKDLSNVDTEKKDYVKPRDDEEYRKEKELDFANRQKDMINSAYNLYNKVLQTPSITELTGYVLDQSGNPMEGAHLKVFSDDYSVLVAETITKPDGAYTLKVPMHTKSYRIDISKAGYVSTTIYDVDTSIDAVSSFQENIYMYREGQGEYTIRLNLIDALHGENINDAKVIIRSGINNKKGTIVKQFNLSDYYPDYMYDDYLYDDEYLYDDYMYEPFYYDVRLYPGNYTAEIQS
ncbi:MAG: hypothetical protein GX366_09040, partial [Epulopiscium sp.]|nr:hypothetical protein [Candidatus Epulonipiscium sp.]